MYVVAALLTASIVPYTIIATPRTNGRLLAKAEQGAGVKRDDANVD
jgi:hypothetical protein